MRSIAPNVRDRWREALCRVRKIWDTTAHVPPGAWLIPDVIARQRRWRWHGRLIPMRRYYFGIDLELVIHHAIETELFACELQTVARAVSGQLSISQQFQNRCRHLFLRPGRYDQAMLAIVDDF